MHIDVHTGLDSPKGNWWKPAHKAEKTWVVIAFIWCMILNYRNKSFRDYNNGRTPLFNNYLFAALAGTIWFLQFFFYGMGESKLGNGASSWILHMAFIILVSTMWGFVFREWKGVHRKTLRTILLGIGVIIASVVIVGYGNSLL